jgi:hypothetical protein
MPFDPEAEWSVLAEIAAPLHHVDVVDTITSAMFYDGKNARIVEYLRGGLPDVPEGDLVYLAHAVKYAFPLTRGALASFFDCAARRARLCELEAERLELLGLAS